MFCSAQILTQRYGQRAGRPNDAVAPVRGSSPIKAFQKAPRAMFQPPAECARARSVTAFPGTPEFRPRRDRVRGKPCRFVVPAGNAGMARDCPHLRLDANRFSEGYVCVKCWRNNNSLIYKKVPVFAVPEDAWRRERPPLNADIAFQKVS